VILAGPTRPLEDLILEQFEYIFSLDNVISDEEKQHLDEMRSQVERVKNLDISRKVNAKNLPLGLPMSYWMDLKGYKPAEAARELQRPVLVLQGARDYNVTMDDYDGWKLALADIPNVRFRCFPELNHSFMAGTGKSTPEEYQIAGHVSEEVITEISDWMKTVNPVHNGVELNTVR